MFKLRKLEAKLTKAHETVIGQDEILCYHRHDSKLL